MKFSIKVSLLLLYPVFVFVAACGTENPGNDTDDDGESDVTVEYYPIEVDAFWKYRETATGSTPIDLTYTITKKETMDFEGETGEREVFFMENTFDLNAERRIQFIEDDGVQVVRHGHEVYDDTGLTKTRFYTPGFLRFDRSKVKAGEEWTQTVSAVTDTLEVDENGDYDDSGKYTEEMTYAFKVNAVGTPVTIDLGTFNCIEIERENTTEPETKIYWYAPDIGKIKELTVDSGKVEELVDSSYF